MVKRSKDLNKSSGNLNLEKKLWFFIDEKKERESSCVRERELV